MSEFIKIKDDTGKFEMLLRVKLILRVYDREMGGSIVTYGENVGNNGANYEVFRTASTAAEVLAAIKGAQTVTGVMAVGGGSNGIGSLGPGDILYSTTEATPRTRPTDTSERLGLVSRGGYESEHGELTEILRVAGERVLTKLDPSILAVVCAGQMLARELENRTGDKWKVTAQPTPIGFYFALEWGEFRGRTDEYLKPSSVETEDGQMAEWAQEIAEEMVAKALRERPIGISYSGYIRPEALDSLTGKEPAKEGVGKGLCVCKEIVGDNRECPIHHLPSRTDCTCRNLISGHDPDCPWHGG
jgi:hypothetical protein